MLVVIIAIIIIFIFSVKVLEHQDETSIANLADHGDH